MTADSLVELLRDDIEIPPLRIVDVGANPLGGRRGPYQHLVDAGQATLLGFEPDPQVFAELAAARAPGETYLPLAVGDGARHKLRICAMSGMNSLLEPNFALLDLTHLHGQWAQVREVVEIDTVRLDEVPEARGMDYLKIDIQGGELMAFEHAQARLDDCLVVHTEAMFVPMYVGQPLFAEQELALRRHGLMVHTFTDVAGHALKPFAINNDPHAPISQLFWADVVFIRDITRLERLSDAQLLKLAVILHEVYHSMDVAYLLLREHDRRGGADLARKYAGWAMPRYVAARRWTGPPAGLIPRRGD